MNTRITSAIVLALASLSAGHAMAADPSAPKTREQVKAELAEAIRTGDILADVDSGGNRKMNEVYPQRYPLKAAAN